MSRSFHTLRFPKWLAQINKMTVDERILREHLEKVMAEEAAVLRDLEAKALYVQELEAELDKLPELCSQIATLQSEIQAKEHSHDSLQVGDCHHSFLVNEGFFTRWTTSAMRPLRVLTDSVSKHFQLCGVKAPCRAN